MNTQKLKELLEQANIDVSAANLESFGIYYQELLDWNERCNLTSITAENEVLIKHFYDSLLIMKLTEWSGKGALLDIGTGAGFPGIPLKLLNPALQITLVDSLKKRVVFLEHIIKLLALKETTAMHARAEDIYKDAPKKDRYDYVVSRAVAKLPVLLEYSLPFVKMDGFFLAYKGPDIADEVKSAENALKVLGGKIIRIAEYELPEGAGGRTILVVRKTRATPPCYPRKAGQPEKKPL